MTHTHYAFVQFVAVNAHAWRLSPAWADGSDRRPTTGFTLPIRRAERSLRPAAKLVVTAAAGRRWVKPDGAD